MDAIQVKKKTLQAMTKMYCQRKHDRHTDMDLCPACHTFMTYAVERLDNCRKTSQMNCKACNIHCYDSYMQSYVKGIMRYSGKHMLYRHPILTCHYLYNKTIASLF